MESHVANSLMQKAIMNSNAYKYDLPCIFVMYIHQVWQHQINKSNSMIKYMSMFDINFRPTVDINLMLTFEIANTFIFYLWVMVI